MNLKISSAYSSTLFVYITILKNFEHFLLYFLEEFVQKWSFLDEKYPWRLVKKIQRKFVVIPGRWFQGAAVNKGVIEVQTQNARIFSDLVEQY
jgi:hypothetical protein